MEWRGCGCHNLLHRETWTTTGFKCARTFQQTHRHHSYCRLEHTLPCTQYSVCAFHSATAPLITLSHPWYCSKIYCLATHGVTITSASSLRNTCAVYRSLRARPPWFRRAPPTFQHKLLTFDQSSPNRVHLCRLDGSRLGSYIGMSPLGFSSAHLDQQCNRPT